METNTPIATLKMDWKPLSLFNEHHPDLIFMDDIMPVMDGIEATRLIRDLSTEVPIIVAITTYAYESNKEDAFNAGCNYFPLRSLCRSRH